MCFGGGESREPAPRPARNIGPPRDVTIHIPRNRADPHGVPIPKTTEEIHRADIVNALQLMAHYLQSQHAQITAVTVGGAVNTILLKTRPTTHDVDIFGSNLDTQSRILLDAAMQYALQHSNVNLGTDWFNTETQMWMSPSMQQELTRLAAERDVVVFTRPGLTLLAAPWEYALSAKLSRVSARTHMRTYDLDDAVQYLHQLVGRQRKPISRSRMREWASHYNHQISDEVVKSLNRAYQRQYGAPGITS